MKQIHTLGPFVLAFFCSAVTNADVIPDRGRIDGRIRTVAYNEDQVVRLHGVVGYQIDLQFESGESFVGMGAGDIDAISFVGQDNHLFLKPKAARVATNLTVLTTRRHYQLQYAVGGPRGAPDNDEVIYSVRFTYSSPFRSVPSDADRPDMDQRLREAAQNTFSNADYWYCGHPSLKPVVAEDNGVHTRLRFTAQSELPAIFVRNDDGSESLLNFNVSDGDVIVHRVARRFVVRRGRVTGCIVNAGFSGGGERLRSGTISPDVRRETQGGNHE